jgi:hypothetical protein
LTVSASWFMPRSRDRLASSSKINILAIGYLLGCPAARLRALALVTSEC